MTSMYQKQSLPFYRGRLCFRVDAKIDIPWAFPWDIDFIIGEYLIFPSKCWDAIL